MNAAGASPKRLLSLDVMRGATIVAMITVNNPGTWSALYWPLGHADWHGWTPTDLIFPFFLFMVGVAMAYSFSKYTNGERPGAAVWWRITRRVALLILLGLLLAASGQLYGLMLGQRSSLDFSVLRWPGVLQRIGLAYLGASAIVLLLKPKLQAAAGVLLLVVYTLLVSLLPANVAPDQRLTTEGNIVRVVDLALIGPDHMWTRATTRPTDPEGLLSTLPSIVTALIGYATGRRLKQNPISTAEVTRLLFVGLAIAAAGQAWNWGPHPGWGMPINKALWTPSFVLLSGGLGMATLAACLWLFDIVGAGNKTLGRVATAFQMVGVNAIFAFVASGMVARLMTVLKVGDQTLKGWVYENLISQPLTAVGLSDPKLASATYAAVFVACWWLVLWGMWKKGWTIRV